MRYTLLIAANGRALSWLTREFSYCENFRILVATTADELIESLDSQSLDLVVIAPGSLSLNDLSAFGEKICTYPSLTHTVVILADSSQSSCFIHSNVATVVCENFADDCFQKLMSCVKSSLFKTHSESCTERHLIHAELLNSQIVNSDVGGIVYSDKGLFCHLWNPYMERLTGVPASEVIGRQVLNKFDFLQTNGTADVVDLALSQGIRSEIEIEFDIKETQKHGWVTLTIGPLLDANLEIVGVLSFVHDVTARKMAELEMVRLKHHFQAIIEKSLDGYVLLNAEGVFSYLSPTALRLFGYRSEEMLLKNPHDLTHPEDVSRVIEQVIAVLENPGLNPVIEYRFRHSDGRWIWIESSFTNLMADPAVESLVINFHIIHARKEAEALLLRDEKRLENLRKINEMYFESLQHLLDTALNEIISLTESEIGFICACEEEDNRFELVAWSKDHLAAQYSTQKKVPIRSNGIWAEVVKNRTPLVVNHFESELHSTGSMPLGHSQIDRFVIIPIVHENKLVAMAAVANKKEPYDDMDVRQLNLMMSSVWKIVAKKQAEIRLNASEERFRTVFESSGVGKSITGGEGNLSVNKAFADILGYSVAELDGINWREITHPEDIAMSEEELGRIEAGEKDAIAWEKRYIHKTGRVVWVSINTTLVRDIERNASFYVTEIYDITDAKEAARRIRESEERYRMLAENTSDVIWKTDSNGQFTYVSPSVSSMLGYTVDAVLADDFLETEFHALVCELKKILSCLGSEVENLQTSQEHIVELELICRDGSRKWTESTATIVFDEQGNVLGLVGVTRDVTVRVTAEKELKNNQEMLKRLYLESTRFIDMDGLDYDNIAQEVMSLAGARFCAFNVVDEDNDGFRTVAISGWDHILKPVGKILGFNPMNRKWKYDSYRKAFIGGRMFTRFHSLADLARNVIPSAVINLVTRMFRIGEVWIVQMKKNDKAVGDFTILFEKGCTLKNREILELYVTQVGLFLDRMRSVAALSRSEEKHRNLIQKIPDGVYKSTHYGKFLDANPALVQMLGYESKEELLNINILSDLYFSVADRDESETSEDTRSVFPLRKKDGSAIWVEDHGWYNVDSEGRIISHEGVLRDVTQRMKDEEYLRDSEQKFRLLFETNPQPMFIYDLETFRILDANRAAEVHYGYLKQELLGLTVGHLRRNEAGMSLEELNNQIRNTHETNRSFTTSHKTKDNRVIDVEVYSSSVMVDGRMARQVLVNDITERLRAEKALITSESDLSEALRLGKMGFWEYDVSHDEFLFNDQFYAIYNATADQVGGYRMSRMQYTDLFVHPGDRDSTELVMREVMASQGEIRIKIFEHRIVCLDGVVKDIIVTIKPELTANGRLLRIFGANQDITDRKQAELMLEKSETFFRSSQKAAHIGSYVMNLETNVWESSQVLDELFGIDSSYEHLLTNLRDIVYEEDLEMMQRYFEDDVVLYHKSLDKECRIRRLSDNEVRWVHMLGELLVVDGNVVKVTGTIQDVTDRKRAEIELQMRMDELIRFHRVTIGRELAVVELKKEVNQLLIETGKGEKYKIFE